MACVFCSSVEIKNRQISENELAWAFLSNMPIVPGHTLIVPKRCVPKYEGLTNEERFAIEDLRIKLLAALRIVLKAEGFNFAWNDAEIAGQSVPHFHLHIVPRKEGDVGVYEYEPRKFLYRPGSREETPEDELNSLSEQLRKAAIF